MNGALEPHVPPGHSTLIIRSYQGESTGSHPNSEVKHPWACSVLRWGTTWESQVTNVLHLLRLSSNLEPGEVTSPGKNRSYRLVGPPRGTLQPEEATSPGSETLLHVIWYDMQ